MHRICEFINELLCVKAVKAYDKGARYLYSLFDVPRRILLWEKSSIQLVLYKSQ